MLRAYARVLAMLLEPWPIDWRVMCASAHSTTCWHWPFRHVTCINGLQPCGKEGGTDIGPGATVTFAGAGVGPGNHSNGGDHGGACCSRGGVWRCRHEGNGVGGLHMACYGRRRGGG